MVRGEPEGEAGDDAVPARTVKRPSSTVVAQRTLRTHARICHFLPKIELTDAKWRRTQRPHTWPASPGTRRSRWQSSCTDQTVQVLAPRRNQHERGVRGFPPP